MAYHAGCPLCSTGRHRWGEPTIETCYPPGWVQVALYRWRCLCPVCAPPCRAAQTQVHPTLPLEIDVPPSIVTAEPDQDAFAVRTPRPWPTPAKASGPPRPGPEMLARVLRGLEQL